MQSVLAIAAFVFAAAGADDCFISEKIDGSWVQTKETFELREKFEREGHTCGGDCPFGEQCRTREGSFDLDNGRTYLTYVCGCEPEARAEF